MSETTKTITSELKNQILSRVLNNVSNTIKSSTDAKGTVKVNQQNSLVSEKDIVLKDVSMKNTFKSGFNVKIASNISSSIESEAKKNVENKLHSITKTSIESDKGVADMIQNFSGAIAAAFGKKQINKTEISDLVYNDIKDEMDNIINSYIENVKQISQNIEANQSNSTITRGKIFSEGHKMENSADAVFNVAIDEVLKSDMRNKLDSSTLNTIDKVFEAKIKEIDSFNTTLKWITIIVIILAVVFLAVLYVVSKYMTPPISTIIGIIILVIIVGLIGCGIYAGYRLIKNFNLLRVLGMK